MGRSSVTDMNTMFYEAQRSMHRYFQWDSSVTDMNTCSTEHGVQWRYFQMGRLFRHRYEANVQAATAFNGDISKWDVSSVKMTAYMFEQRQRSMAIFPNGMSPGHQHDYMF
jgi:hypothetical protein